MTDYHEMIKANHNKDCFYCVYASGIIVKYGILSNKLTF